MLQAKHCDVGPLNGLIQSRATTGHHPYNETLAQAHNFQSFSKLQSCNDSAYIQMGDPSLAEPSVAVL